MRNMSKNLVIILISAIVLALFASCSTLSGKEEPTVVSVSGNGIVYLEADTVKFSINVSESAETTGEAQQRTNEKMSRILDILKQHGIEDEDISTTALNFSSDYYWDNGRQIKTGESVSQTVYVTMKNIEDFSSLADDLGNKLSGISFYNVSFDSTQKVVASKAARELAYQNALEKAQLYAKQAGLEVSRPLSINEGYVSYSTANYKSMYMEDMVMTMEAAAAPSYGTQTPTGLLSATIDVSVTFELK
ncbi:MAG: SIMPL domain-containing protein [Spirochaetales bacterium]|nr:SIMPL domain-containing protein [Spirochaetales bacterium]